MKKKLPKLALSRETVRRLEPAHRSLVAGGFTQVETCGFTCKGSCGENTRCSICCF